MCEIDMTKVAKKHCYPKQVNKNGMTVGYVLADRDGYPLNAMQFEENTDAKNWARENGLKCEWDAHWAWTEDLHDYLVHHPFKEDYDCIFVGGKYDGKRMSVAEVRKAGMVSGKHENLSARRARGFLCAGELFDDAPTVAGYLGPMYGGTDTPLRYESSEVYAALSV